MLKAEFMGANQIGLGLFQELWSDVGPNPETMGLYLKQVPSPNVVLLQALTSWKRPFIGADKVSSANPDHAFQQAITQFNCRYFEVYSADVRSKDLEPVFNKWALKLDPTGFKTRTAQN